MSLLYQYLLGQNIASEQMKVIKQIGELIVKNYEQLENKGEFIYQVMTPQNNGTEIHSKCLDMYVKHKWITDYEITKSDSSYFYTVVIYRKLK